MKYEDLKVLAKYALGGKPNSNYSIQGENYSYSEINEAIRVGLKEMLGTPDEFEQNKYKLFALIRETVSEALPQNVREQYSMFAEIKHFAQGDRPVFTERITEASKRRARKFVTNVGLAGRYEVFKLDGRSYEVTTSAYGAAAQIGYEEMLDGRVDYSELVQIIMEGIDERLFDLIASALKAAVGKMQSNNKISQAGFSESAMDKLIEIADSYGGKSAIYCTFEFAATMKPAEGWASDSMKDDLWKAGYIAVYKNHPVIIFKQSFVDETHTQKQIDPALAYIIPVGGSKPISIAFEGDLQVKDFDNRDWSKEIQMYQKMGVAAKLDANFCVYENTSLKQNV